VLAAGDGSAALALSPWRPDLIVLDLLLPDGRPGGMPDLAQRGEVPIIMLTAPGGRERPGG
jgi:DNA-binding response OmpR family regulator